MSKPIPIPRNKVSDEKKKNANTIRMQNDKMLEEIYIHCKHHCDDLNMLRTLGQTNLVAEGKHFTRETIAPATVRTEAPSDWRIDNTYVWLTGEHCIITI